MKTTPVPPIFHRLFRISLLGLSLMASTTNILGASEETLLPIQDAFIRPGTAADDNFNKNQLELAGRTGDVNRKIYLQFELPQSATKITGARLQLFIKGVIANEGDPVESSVAFKVFAAPSDNPELWNEASITWNNAPGNSSGPTEADTPWVEVGTVEVPLPVNSPEQMVEINLADLPGLLKKERGRHLTLILTPSTQKIGAPGLYFYSTQADGKQQFWPALILAH